MKRISIKAIPKASLSLACMLNAKPKKLPNSAMLSAGLRSLRSTPIQAEDKVSLLVEGSEGRKLDAEFSKLGKDDAVEHLGGDIYSAEVSLTAAKELLKSKSVSRLQTKKRSQLNLDSVSTSIGMRTTSTGSRLVTETGKGVLIGIIDSGFDLSHPMFYDKNGKLRVEALLDQEAKKEYDSTTIASKWPGVGNPSEIGGDPNGHGTHVASIAGGSPYKGLEGIAPDARFLLVKTDFFNTAKAVSWVFNKAGTKPCVVNMSLGHHWGAHDGTELEEKLHDQISKKGKIIVVSAGNERGDSIHIGHRFATNESQTVAFKLLRQVDTPPFAAITLWYDNTDKFDIDLISPAGQVFPVPAVGNIDQYTNSMLDIEIGREQHPAGFPATKVQIQLSFKNQSVSSSRISNWKLRVHCKTATIGRIDGWMNNSGFGEFKAHSMVEAARTIGLPATGSSCISVASHVSKAKWKSDTGSQSDSSVVNGRSSPFSSVGPTRDDRQKPEISAPGQYVTAALAESSESSGWDDRAHSTDRILTIEGTSMAAPVVTGAIALMLQKKATLTPSQIQKILKESASTDAHTGTTWNPTYGYGKLDIAKAISKV